MTTKFDDVANVTTGEYFKENQFAVDMFLSKYAHTKNEGEKENPAEVFQRNCRELGQFEKDNSVLDNWFSLMFDGWFRPGGSIISGLGSGRKESLANCCSIPINDDSLEALGELEYNLMKCAAYRQGIGVDLSPLRPRGSKLGNAAEESTGAVPWGKKSSEIGNYVGQCLDGDVEITTNEGKVKIKDLIEDDFIKYVKTHKGEKNIVNRMNNGHKELFKLTTTDGDEILATEDHRFVIYDTIDDQFKLVKLKDIRNTDKIVKEG